MLVHEDIERVLEERAGIYAVAESEGAIMTLSGLIHSEADRQTALEIATSLAPGKRIIDKLEIATAPSEKIGEMSLPPWSANPGSDSEAAPIGAGAW